MPLEPDSVITPPSVYKRKNIRFPNPTLGVPPMGSNVRFYRQSLKIINPDGTCGDVLLKTEKLFSFGVQEPRDTSSVISYKLPLCLWNRNGRTEAEKAWSDMFFDIIDACKEHLVKLKNDSSSPVSECAINEDVLRDFDETIVKDRNNPILGNCKLDETYIKNTQTEKNEKTFITRFYDEKTGDMLSFKNLINTHMYVVALIKMDNIYIARKNTYLQVRVIEANVNVVDKIAKSFLESFRGPNRIAGNTHHKRESDDEDGKGMTNDADSDNNTDNADNADDNEDNDDNGDNDVDDVGTGVDKIVLSDESDNGNPDIEPEPEPETEPETEPERAPECAPGTEPVVKKSGGKRKKK